MTWNASFVLHCLFLVFVCVRFCRWHVATPLPCVTWISTLTSFATSVSDLLLTGGVGSLLFLFLYGIWTLRTIPICQPPFRKDVRFTIPIPMSVTLTGCPPTEPRRRPRNPVRHAQFGIHSRLRWTYDLFPKRKAKHPHPHVGSATPHASHPTRNRTKKCGTERHPVKDPEEAWISYWDSEVNLLPGIPDEKWMMDLIGFPALEIDYLLALVDSIGCVDIGTYMDNHFVLPGVGHEVQFGAFIATADLMKELHYNRTPGSKQEVAYLSGDQSKCDVPVVFDTGCSFSVTPFKEDFVTNLETTKVRNLVGLKESVMIKGVGWVEWPIRDVFGQRAVVRTQAYYVPEANIRLCSPQCYFQENETGHCYFDKAKLVFTTADGRDLTFPYNHNSNIPLMEIDRDICQAGLTTDDIIYLA